MARALLVAGALLALATPASAQDAIDTARVDGIFARWSSSSTPGCAVGVARSGAPFFTRAYGMADLEHEIPNTPATIFEAGSVAKQFTAAVVVLLALDGRLSLDEDVRRYVPELPDHGSVITIRHLLTHTSGLRDWGSLAAIAGRGRGVRTHTHEDVLDILARQRALNFAPGTEYSYSNSGYNLLAIIVDRVSGMSFAEFSRTHLFEPLGLVNTQWREDYTRIVKGRSAAYSARGGGYVIERPIEHVHGNGGLLTTVGDLLAWNEALAEGRVGGREFVALMHERGVLNDGSRIEYASGISVRTYGDVPEISHTGSTAGYAFLARYPEQRLGVAVLCNAGDVNPGRVGRQVADAFLGRSTPETPVVRPQIPASVSDGRPRLEPLAGDYHSPDIETTLSVVVEDERLLLRRRPAAQFLLIHERADTFRAANIGRVVFLRENGQVTGLSVRQERVHDLRFERAAQIPEIRVQPDAPVGGTASRSGALNAALASAGTGPVRLLLAPGRYVLDAHEHVDPACGNCEDAAETVPATVGVRVSGTGIEIVGSHADSVIIETRAGYGLLLDGCADCTLRAVTITGGVRDADGRATSAGIVARHSTAIIESCVIRDNIGDSATVARTIVGIAGIAVRENAQLTVRDCHIMRNSWDGIALYRGASATVEGNIVDGVDKASGARVGGGRGVGIGLTWDAQATIRHNLVRRYWKGIGAFVNARADISENIVEDILTWGIALWGPNGATPSARIRRNVVYRTGACGVMIDRPAGGAAPGELTDNIIMRTGQNERYDAGEPYCWQRPIARASVPETFSESGNLLTDNRQPRDAGSAPAPLPEIDAAALAGRGAALAEALHAHAALRNALFFAEHPALVRR